MAAVFCLTSSGRSARSSLYSRQAVVSSFWCHRLERPAISMSHLRRHSRFEDSDSRPFWFPVPTKTLFYVTVTNHRYCLDTCGPCNNQHYLGHVKVFMMMMMMMMNCKHELQAPHLIPVQISCTVSRWSHVIYCLCHQSNNCTEGPVHGEQGAATPPGNIAAHWLHPGSVVVHSSDQVSAEVPCSKSNALHLC